MKKYIILMVFIVAVTAGCGSKEDNAGKDAKKSVSASAGERTIVGLEVTDEKGATEAVLAPGEKITLLARFVYSNGDKKAAYGGWATDEGSLDPASGEKVVLSVPKDVPEGTFGVNCGNETNGNTFGDSFKITIRKIGK